MPGPGTNMRGIGTFNKNVFGRIVKLFLKEYPLAFSAVILCTILSAVIGVVPAIFVERITSYIEIGLSAGWEAIRPDVLKALGIMVALFAVSILATTVQQLILAEICNGFLHKIRTGIFTKLPVIHHRSCLSVSLIGSPMGTSCPSTPTMWTPCGS